MKNVKKVLILALVLSALMCVSAFAGDTTIAKVELTSGTLITENEAKDQVQFSMSYSGTDGQMYLLMVLNNTLEEGKAPEAKDILYVNQETVKEDGKATFATVYPTEIKDSVIYLAGGNLGKLTQIGTIKANAPAYTVEKIGKYNTADFSITNNTLNVVNNSYACVVAYTNSDRTSYTRLAAIVNSESGYDFDISSVPNGAVVIIAVKGDISGDGELKGREITQIKAEQLGNTNVFTALQKLVADVNGDGTIKGREVTQIKAAQLGNAMLVW